MKARYLFLFMLCVTPSFATEAGVGGSEELSLPFKPAIQAFKERKDLGFIHITDLKTLEWARQHTSHFDDPEGASQEKFFRQIGSLFLLRK